MPIERGGRSTVETFVSRFVRGDAQLVADTLAVEEPLEIQLAYGPDGNRQVKSISVTMRTPGYDFDLAAGFLMTEGVVRDPEDITNIFYVAGRSVAAGTATVPSNLPASGCGEPRHKEHRGL